MDEPSFVKAMMAYADAEWNINAAGRALADTDDLYEAVKGLLQNGALAQTYGRSILQWEDDPYTVFEQMRSSAQTTDGRSHADYIAACSPFLSQQIKRWKEDPYDPNRTVERSEKESQRDIASRLKIRLTTLDKIHEIRQRNDRLIQDAARDGFRQGQALVFRETAGGFEFLHPEKVLDVLHSKTPLKVKFRITLSKNLPATLLREKGKGPRSGSDVGQLRRAEEYFLECIKKAQPNKPWKTKDDGFLELKRRFPSLSRNAYDRIWRENATDRMKRGCKDPET